MVDYPQSQREQRGSGQKGIFVEENDASAKNSKACHDKGEHEDAEVEEQDDEADEDDVVVFIIVIIIILIIIITKINP